VPSAALTTLPFHLLVTEKPPAAIPDRLEGYRDAAWLLRRQGRLGAAFGGQPEIPACLCPQGSGCEADDRLRRSCLQPRGF